MRNSKLIVSAAVALSAIIGIGAASAADMAPAPTYTKAPVVVAPVYSWTGWYVGINGGGVWSNDHLTSVPTDPATAGFFGPCFTLGACPRDYGPTNGSSGEVGGQVGYNWQMKSLVLGIEGDLQWTNINSTAAVANAILAPFAGTATSRLDWFGTGRGRIGLLATPSWLLYATGGVAFGDLRRTFSGGFPSLGQTFFGSSNDTRVGWVVGAGSEWKFAQNWIVGLEYLHMELDSNSFSATTSGAGCTLTGLTSCNFTVSDRFKADIVRARLSYQFGGPVVAKY
jgi:outer membrane immunogenic protein